MNRKAFVYIMGLLVLVSLLATVGCQTKEVEVTREVPVEKEVEVTREVPVEKEVEVTREVEVEVPTEVEVTRIVTEEVVKEVQVTAAVEEETGQALTLAALAEGIMAGDIDVGEDFGLALDQRFHIIHAEAVGMACTQCHVQDAPLERAEVPAGAPGPVDRRVCLGCHLTGPAAKLYEPKE